MTTQKELIKKHLETGSTITPLEALQEYGCFRLASVIFKLKNEYGMKIESTSIKKDGKTFAEYKLTY